MQRPSPRILKQGKLVQVSGIETETSLYAEKASDVKAAEEIDLSIESHTEPKIPVKSAEGRKYPAYERQSISRLKRIVAPIPPIPQKVNKQTQTHRQRHTHI